MAEDGQLPMVIQLMQLNLQLNYKGFFTDRHFVAVFVFRQAGLDQVIIIYIAIYMRTINTNAVSVRGIVVYELRVCVEWSTHVLLFDQRKRSHIHDTGLLSAVVHVRLGRCA